MVDTVATLGMIMAAGCVFVLFVWFLSSGFHFFVIQCLVTVIFCRVVVCNIKINSEAF